MDEKMGASPTERSQELPALIKDGYTSFKIYMTYDAMKVSDYQILDILALARKEGALVMVHAENHDMIQWLAHHLIEQGHGAPKFHAIAHARVAEAEATNRAISLARLVDAPMLIVHMSEIEAIETLRQAQKKGLKIFGETCPQYIALTADDKTVEKKDRNPFEPVQFYLQGQRQTSEIVVQKVLKDRIVGYISTPKVKDGRS